MQAKKKILSLFPWPILSLAIPLSLISGLLFSPLVCSVRAGNLEWRAHSHPFYDHDGQTPLRGTLSSPGDLIQLIWTGADEIANPPNQDGSTGGDDQLVTDSSDHENPTYIGYGLGPPSLIIPTGKFYVSDITYSLPTGSKVYTRAFNAHKAIEASHYGDSAYHTLTNQMAESWDCTESAPIITNKSLLPETFITIEMSLPRGWSIVSLPVEPALKKIKDLFPEATAIYDYTTEYIDLDPNDELETKKAYWIYLEETHTYSLRGEPIDYYSVPQARSGWSLIGSCSYPSVPSVDHGIIKAVFGFTTKYNLYGYSHTIRPLEPGQGFWIYLSDAANLLVARE